MQMAPQGRSDSRPTSARLPYPPLIFPTSIFPTSIFPTSISPTSISPTSISSTSISPTSISPTSPNIQASLFTTPLHQRHLFTYAYGNHSNNADSQACGVPLAVPGYYDDILAAKESIGFRANTFPGVLNDHPQSQAPNLNRPTPTYSVGISFQHEHGEQGTFNATNQGSSDPNVGIYSYNRPGISGACYDYSHSAASQASRAPVPGFYSNIPAAANESAGFRANTFPGVLNDHPQSQTVNSNKPEAVVHRYWNLEEAFEFPRLCCKVTDDGYRCSLHHCTESNHESLLRAKVYEHIQKEIAARPHYCFCNKRYKRKSDCERHIKESNDPKQYRCEVEGCTFIRGRKDVVLTHQRSHKDEIAKGRTKKSTGKAFF